MRLLKTRVSVWVAVALFGCGRNDDDKPDWHGGDRSAVNHEEAAAVANHELTISVPEACAITEDGQEPEDCENWLGLREDGIGLTHHQQRLSFSIEEVDEHGRFRIAAYPDCKRDERLAAAEAAQTPEPHTEPLPEVEPYASISTGLEGVQTGDAPPLVGDPNLSIAPPADTGTGTDIRTVAVEALSKPLFPECRRLIAPGELGQPVRMVDPLEADSLGNLGWWQVRMPEGERPVFVNMFKCKAGKCPIRLLLGEGDRLVAVNEDEVQLGLGGFFKKLKGSLSKAWNSGVQTVADAAKAVGTVKTIDKLGGKKLYVSAATPAARLYSAVKEQGPEVVSLANGAVKDGTVYVKIGAEYANQAGQATLTGLNYIAEYIQANACFLGVSTGLSTAVAREAAFYEAPLSILAATFAEQLASTAAADALMANPEFYGVINGAATAISIPTSLVSSRFSAAEWRSILIDILFSAMTGDVKGGFVGIIIGKIAEAICLGIDKATSPQDAAESTITVNGISDACLSAVKANALARAELGEDMCYAMKDEIKIESARPPPSRQVLLAWKAMGKNGGACPVDPNDPAFLALLEGVGCKGSPVYLSDQPKVDPSTILTVNRYWARTTDWFAALRCPTGQVAVGMCSSGGGPDCYKMPKELLCASLPSGASLTTTSYVDKVKNADNPALSICPEGFVITEFCSSGGNNDCDNRTASQKIRCRQIAPTFQIDYGNCTLKEAKTWGARLQSTSPNDVMVGACASGKNPDCGQRREFTKSALFCSIKPAAAGDGTRVVTRFTKGDDSFLTEHIGENPWGFDYDGSFKLYTASAAGRVPFVRCRKSSGGHIMSNSTGCEGFISEGLLGYTSTTEPGVQMIRCLKNGAHFSASDAQECTARGYTVEGGMGNQP